MVMSVALRELAHRYTDMLPAQTLSKLDQHLALRELNTTFSYLISELRSCGVVPTPHEYACLQEMANALGIPLGEWSLWPRHALESPTHSCVQSRSQAKWIRARIRFLRRMGAEDLRIGERQVNMQGEVVGYNEPDIQYTYMGVRYNELIDTTTPVKTPGHADLILLNDPSCKVYEWTVD